MERISVYCYLRKNTLRLLASYWKPLRHPRNHRVIFTCLRNMNYFSVGTFNSSSEISQAMNIHCTLLPSRRPLTSSSAPTSLLSWRTRQDDQGDQQEVRQHHTGGERDVAQSIACPPLKRSVVGSILLSGPSCSLGYFPFQPVVHNWFIKGRGMYCSVYGKVHIKDPLLLIEMSSLCGGSGFPSKKCVNVTIWMTSNNRW